MGDWTGSLPLLMSMVPLMPVNDGQQRVLTFLGLTAVFVGFFMVWMAHGAAGLSIIGLEMGEQAKFLPQVRSGEIAPGRSLFYLPPITVALLLILLSAHWPPGRWQTWAVRLGAVAISLLAFPALEALGTEAAEWLWRVLMIGVVILAFLLSPLLRRLSTQTTSILILAISLAGAVLPAWAFVEVRAAFAELLPEGVGVGAGVWANVGGHLLVAVVAVNDLGLIPHRAVSGEE